MSEKKTLKSIVLFLVVLFCLSSFGCGKVKTPSLVIDNFTDADSSGITLPQGEQTEWNRFVSFTIWSHQLTNAAEAEEYAILLKDIGISTIEFAVLWSDFEYEQKKFSWKFVDSVIDTFLENGFAINLSIVLWTYNLSFVDKLDLQQTAEGEIYSYDSVRSSFISISSENNINIVKNTLFAFASHINAKYPDKISGLQIRYSENGAEEFSSTIDLDYCESAFNAFVNWLSDKYETASDFSKMYSLKYKEWDDVRAADKATLTSKCNYEWKMFKQDAIVNFHDIAEEIFTLLCPTAPIAVNLGSVGNSMSTEFKGVFDPYTIISKCDAETVIFDCFTDLQYNFYFDMISSVTNKNAVIKLDGPVLGQDEFEKTLILAESAGKTGILGINVSDWRKNEISEYSDYLKAYINAFQNSEIRQDADTTDVIVINTLDYIVRIPSSSIYDLYKYAYKNMTGKSNRKVLFFTDTQIIENPSLLDGVKKVHLGSLNTITYMYEQLGDILTSSNYKIVDDDNEQPNFLNEYGKPLDSDIQDTLRNRLKNS